MAGYRFCRSDDIPLLVAAHNACWVPHFGADSAITVEDFKRGIRQIGLWSSSCMVAFEGDEPIGVLIAAKRDGVANFVHRLAVKPGFERQGHGRHLLTSLVDKAAILKPDRVLTEVPADWSGARRFLERSGFVEEARYADFVLDGPPSSASAGARVGAELVMPVTLEELIESGAFHVGLRRAWSRTAASLRGRAAELEGLAIATDRIEAYVLASPAAAGGGREIVAIGGEPSAAGVALLQTLLDMMRPAEGILFVSAAAEAEVPFATLEALGFRRARDVIGYVVSRA